MQTVESSRFVASRTHTVLSSWGLSFFITAAGLIGLGPADLNPDDKIVLCYGSHFPIALR